jgi:hypothetical protein
MNLFKRKTQELNPLVLRRHNVPPNDFKFEEVPLKGLFYRVIPETAREVFFLQTLNKGSTIYAPADGDGLIVRADIIEFS